MKTVAISLIVTMLMSVPILGAEILAPGDFIIAIDADSASSSPGAETVDHAIDGATQKYLNFGENNSGFIVTPGAGVSIVDSFVLTTANDAEERDPATWELYGTNEPIVSADHSAGDAENWTLIASGSVSLPAARNTVGPTVTVSSTAIYASYKMLFPTVKDAGAANSMQIAEVQFFGEANGARNPNPADGTDVGPEYYPPNVYMLLDYTPGPGAIMHTAYFSDNIQDVIDRDEAHSLGSIPPWPSVSETAFVVGYDDPGIPEYARAPLVAGTTYYWCIDTDDGTTVWPGPVWSFTSMPSYAWGPTPADGAELVPTDTTLSWNLGDVETDGYSVRYFLYIGTDEAAVEAIANGDTVSPEYVGTLELTNYDIADLESETEHFWRVDTRLQQALPPFPTTYETGEVWSFTTLPTVDIVDPSLVAWYKLDQEYPGMVFDYSGYANHGTALGNPEWVEGKPDFGKAILLDGTMGECVQVPNDATLNMTTAITVAAWINPNTWSGGNRRILQKGNTDNQYRFWYENGENELRFQCSNVGTVQADAAPPQTGEWNHVAAIYDGATMRIYANGGLVNEAPFTGAISTSSDPLYIGTKTPTSVATDHYDGLLDDLRIYNRAFSTKEMKILAGLLGASDPNPTNGATDVSRTPTLSWTPGAFVGSVNGNVLCYGEDLSAVIARTATSVTLDNPPHILLDQLDLGATFYWVVDTVNDVDGELWEGDVWSFTVVNWIPVDDMESYTPWTTPNNNIFEIWLDGFGDCAGSGNTTGAVLTENADPVLGGIQSMKYDFDNDGTVFSPCDSAQIGGRLKYSKVEVQTSDLVSGIGSDWTVEGVKALSVPFYGTAGNATTESLWVQLKDADKGYGDKVFYGTYEGESLDDFNEASWHDWYIDLADFGVDLGNVISITLGIGDETKDTAFGSGTLYFDEIRLYTPMCVPSRSSAAFATVDYAPEGNRDCVVDYEELAVMTQDWLQSDKTVNPEAISTGPVAWYNFENSLIDSSGNGNNGAAEASETYVPGMSGMGMALDFNGVADAADCGNDPSVDITGEVTTSAWIKLAGSGTDRKVAGNQSGAGGYKMTIFTDDNLEFEIRDSSGAGVLTRAVSGGTALSPGVWYYVAGVCSSADGYLRTYVDGNLDKEMAISTTLAASGANLILGREPYNSINFFGGTMDDVRIYDYALTHGQILTVGGISTPVYVGITSPANVIDGEGTDNLKVNFRDFSVLLDSWGDSEQWPAW